MGCSSSLTPPLWLSPSFFLWPHVGWGSHSLVLSQSLLSELWIPPRPVEGCACPGTWRCCVVRREGEVAPVMCHCCPLPAEVRLWRKAVQWLGSLTGDWRKEWYNLSDSVMRNNLWWDARIQKLASLILFPIYRRSKGNVLSGLWFVLCILVPLHQLPAGISPVQY